MATFPASIPIDENSPQALDLGINAEVMEDGRAQTQSSISAASGIVVWDVLHRKLSQAQRTQVLSFLQNNLAAFTIVDPVSGFSYLGKCVSGTIRAPWEQGAQTYRVQWQFRGEVLP